MVGRAGPERSWRRAMLLAAASVWLPTLLPVVLGMLHDCGHCLCTWWLCMPMVPGALPAVLLQLEDAWFFVVGGAVSLALFGGLALVLRELPRPWSHLAQSVVVLAVAAQAIGFAFALRA